MGTFLFDKIVYGPVQSRRLGLSLGVNLSPADGKRCSFDCIYCECGLNAERRPHNAAPSQQEVKQELEKTLLKMKQESVVPDVITFSGNGEPTMHPDFPWIIEDTIALRNKFCPKARVTVLSNSTMLHKEEVRQALCEVDENIMKLDAADNDLIKQIDQPQINGFSGEELIKQLCSLNGNLTIQTIFLKGTHNGISVDNTEDESITLWIEALKKIRPAKVMIYTINRDTPVKTIKKVPMETLNAIAKKVAGVGFNVTVSG